MADPENLSREELVVALAEAREENEQLRERLRHLQEERAQEVPSHLRMGGDPLHEN